MDNSQRRRLAWIFPGQGSQSVGMGRELCGQSAAARAVFDEADEVLGYPLSRLCFEGPEEELTRTINAQPAILAASLAALAAAKERGDSRLAVPPSFVAGHSVGEFAAVAAAGGLTLADALRLVRERGRLMQQAGDVRPSGMAAVLGLAEEPLAEVCRAATAEASDGEVVQVANLNAPGQVVISGTRAALARASERAKAAGARRVLPLNVSAAFHSPVMAPAAEGLARALAGAPLRDPVVPLVANVTACPTTTPDEIRRLLAEGLCAPVRWQAGVEYMARAGVTTFLEFGSGQVLTAMVKRIAKEVDLYNL